MTNYRTRAKVGSGKHRQLYFDPKIREALWILLQETRSHPFPDLARRIFPELPRKGRISHYAVYQWLKYNLAKVPGQLQAFYGYGLHQEAARERWKGFDADAEQRQEDLALIEYIVANYEFSRIREKIIDVITRNSSSKSAANSS